MKNDNLFLNEMTDTQQIFNMLSHLTNFSCHCFQKRTCLFLLFFSINYNFALAISFKKRYTSRRQFGAGLSASRRAWERVPLHELR